MDYGVTAFSLPIATLNAGITHFYFHVVTQKCLEFTWQFWKWITFICILSLWKLLGFCLKFLPDPFFTRSNKMVHSAQELCFLLMSAHDNRRCTWMYSKDHPLQMPGPLYGTRETDHQHGQYLDLPQVTTDNANYSS